MPMLRSISSQCAIICRMSGDMAAPWRICCRIWAQWAIMVWWSMPAMPAWFMPGMLEWSIPCIPDCPMPCIPADGEPPGPLLRLAAGGAVAGPAEAVQSGTFMA